MFEAHLSTACWVPCWILKKYTALIEFIVRFNWWCFLCSTGWSDTTALWSKEWPWAGSRNAAWSSCPHSFKNQGNFRFLDIGLYLFWWLYDPAFWITQKMNQSSYVHQIFTEPQNKFGLIKILCRMCYTTKSFVCVCGFCFVSGMLTAWFYSVKFS